MTITTIKTEGWKWPEFVIRLSHEESALLWADALINLGEEAGVFSAMFRSLTTPQMVKAVESFSEMRKQGESEQKLHAGALTMELALRLRLANRIVYEQSNDHH